MGKKVKENYPFGLQVVRKTYAGVTVGYVVGWWRFAGRRWARGVSDRSGFQSIREGLIFPTSGAAIKCRDDIEAAREMSKAYVTFEEVDTLH